jgi:hypothetical protein
MKTREERNEERREYHNDVAYDVWRSGGNMDAVDYDRVQDHYYDGDSSESAASHELRAQRQERYAREEQQRDYEQEQYEQIEEGGFQLNTTAGYTAPTVPVVAPIAEDSANF